jgi:hypothetical protein
MREVIRSYYETCNGTDTPMGKAIASFILEKRRDLMREKDFEAIMQSFPAFTVDIALQHKRAGMFNIREVECLLCQSATLVDTSVIVSYYSSISVYCKACKRNVMHG